MRKSVKILRMLVFASSLAFLLANCGGSTSGGSTSAPTSTSFSGPMTLAAGLVGKDNQILSETVTGPLTGPTDNAYFGFSVSAGDFDGDGFTDLAVGIPLDNNESGAVQVFYGSAGGITDNVQAWKQGTAGVGGIDEAGDRFGYSLVAGDFNNDGYADLAIGAPGDNTALGKTGTVYILYGSIGGLVSGGSQIWSQDNVAGPGTAEPGDSFGISLAVGDFNDDGFADLAIGAPGDNTAGVKAGSVNVLYGSSGGLVSGGSQIWSQGTGGVPGVAEPDDQFGFSLAAGDFNGDNVADLAIGAPGDNTALGKSGAVYTLKGSISGLVSDGSQPWSQGIGGVPGVAEPEDQFGFSLAAGDFNGDNVADLAIGVPGDNTVGVKAGAVNILYGSNDGLGKGSLDSQVWSRGNGGVLGVAKTGDRFGHSLAAGDFDGTGFDDLAIGAPGSDSNGFADAGSVNVLYGSATGISTLRNQLWDQGGLDGNGGVEDGDAFGWALAAGDFKGKNVAALAIGAPGEDIPGAVIVVNAGTVNVLYGVVNQPPVADAGSNNTVPVASDNCFARVRLDGTGSYDPDGDPLTYLWTWSGGTLSGPAPEVDLTLGNYTFTLTVDDGFGGTDTDNVVITVVDQTPPVILGIEANPDVLWPPNHKFVPVTYTVRAKDNCDPAPDSRIVGISSNEPVNGLGDGDTAPDWNVTGDLAADLRAERSGKGNGRVYTATITVTDDFGNVARGTEDVVVPHDQR